MVFHVTQSTPDLLPENNNEALTRKKFGSVEKMKRFLRLTINGKHVFYQRFWCIHLLVYTYSSLYRLLSRLVVVLLLKLTAS